MTRTTTDIAYNVTGQTVALRFMKGRPTSATFSVFNDYAGDDDTAEFTGTATVDSVSTTVDVACGVSSADPQQVKLTATTSIEIGRRYLLSEDSIQEWVEPVEIVSGDYIRVRHPLRNDYTTAATFVGTTLTAAIDATWVADIGNISDQIDANPGYRVRWSIVYASATYVEYSFFDLVRATVSHGVDINDIDERAPGYSDSLPVDYRVEGARPLIDSAWRSVQARLSAMKIDTDALRDDSIVDELTILRTLNLIARGGWAPGAYNSVADYILLTQQDYDRFIEQHFQVSQPHRMATGTAGGADVVRQFVIGK